MNHGRINSPPGWIVALQWVAPDEIPTESELAGVALDALDTLREVVEPLTADLDLVGTNPEIRSPQDPSCPAIRSWQLVAASLEDELSVSPMYVGAVISETLRLDRQSLLSWIETALNQDCGKAGTITAWSDLCFRSTCARIYGDPEGQAKLTLESEMGPVEVPVRVVDSTHWVCGPVLAAPFEPPIGLAFYNEGGLISLKIHIHWSWWTEPDAAGRRALENCMAQILDQGWEQISSDFE